MNDKLGIQAMLGMRKLKLNPHQTLNKILSIDQP